MSRWPDLKAHVPWKRGRWQSFSRFFHSPCFLSEVANALAFYHAQTLVFPGFLCELMSYVNLPENKSIRKNKTLFSARLMNLKSCLMSVRGKAKECAGLCGQEPWIKEWGRISAMARRIQEQKLSFAASARHSFTRFFFMKIFFLLQTWKNSDFIFVLPLQKAIKNRTHKFRFDYQKRENLSVMHDNQLLKQHVKPKCCFSFATYSHLFKFSHHFLHYIFWIYQMLNHYSDPNCKADPAGR